MQVDIFCIGSPDISGDCIGPLIGSILSNYTFEHDVNIVGTMDDPVVKDTYDEMFRKLRRQSFVIAIDAALGDRLGEWEVIPGPITPGYHINAGIEPVGTVGIKCYTADTLDGLKNTTRELISPIAFEVSTGLLTLFKGTKKVYI